MPPTDDALTRYRAKRDLERSPEPPGRVRRGRTKLASSLGPIVRLNDCSANVV